MKRLVSVLFLLGLAAPAFAVWPLAQRITTGSNDNLYPSVSYYNGVVTDTVCLVWQRSRTNGWDIYYSTNPTGTAWTTPQALTSQADSNLTPAVAGNHSRWVCAWVNVHGGIQDIAFSRWQAGAWTAPFAISTDGFDDAEPAVWIAELHDSIWVAWSSYRSARWSIISRVYNGSSWSPEIPVVTSPGNNRAPRFFLDPQTRLLGLVWQGDVNGNWDIYLSRFQGGIWTLPQAVTTGPEADITPVPVLWTPSSPYYVNLLWASDSLGNFDIFGTSLDSLTARERITANDSSDTEPAALSHPLPTGRDNLGHPLLTAWTSRRDGNANIYAELFGTQDVVDTNRADDNHPEVTALARLGYAYEWIVWQSNRDGNWNLFGTYQEIMLGVEEEVQGHRGRSESGLMASSPYRPGGRMAFLLPDEGMSKRVRFYDLQGKLLAEHFAERGSPGRYELFWDGRDREGRILPSGLYFLRPEGSPVLHRLLLLR